MPEDSTEKYRQDLAIIRETAEQVLKDFGIFGFEINFSGNPFNAYSELENQLTPLLYELYQKDKSRFQALLYRIDISEHSFRNLLAREAGSGIASSLAALILQREFQKVLTRKYFSK